MCRPRDSHDRRLIDTGIYVGPAEAYLGIAVTVRVTGEEEALTPGDE